MNTENILEKSSENPKDVEISYTEKNASVIFHNLNLSSENPASPEIEVTVEKSPTEITEGNHYLNNIIRIDKENEFRSRRSFSFRL